MCSPQRPPDVLSDAAPAVPAGSAPPARPVTPVSILAMKLARVSRGLHAAPGIDPGLRAELDEACQLAAGLDSYLSRCSTPESPDLTRLARRTRAEDWSARGDPATVPVLEQEMLSGHVEGRMLSMLVHLTRARRVLDVGMFTGYSALAMAEALPDDGEVVACEINRFAASFAQRCFRDSASGHKITVRVGPALATLGDLADAGAEFDLVFIDADKAGYINYFEAVLKDDLLAAGGLICVDNTLMQGQPWTGGTPTANGAAIAAFNEAVRADPRVEQVLVPLRDGLTLIRRTGDRP